MADTSNSVLFDQPGPKGRRTIRIVNWVAALIFVGVLVLILMRLHNPPDGENQLSWELWKPALEREAWTDFYLPGLWMTVKASIVAGVGSVVFGLVFGVGRLLPHVVLLATELLLIGTRISGIRLSELRDKDYHITAALRLIVLPLILYVLLLPLHLDPAVWSTLYLLTAMPCGTLSAMQAELYGGDARFAARAIAYSTLLSLVTVPLISMLL